MIRVDSKCSFYVFGRMIVLTGEIVKLSDVSEQSRVCRVELRSPVHLDFCFVETAVNFAGQV